MNPPRSRATGYHCSNNEVAINPGAKLRGNPFDYTPFQFRHPRYEYKIPQPANWPRRHVGAGGLFFRAPTEHPAHRSAYSFVFAMNATQPATGPAHAFLKFRNNSFYVILSRLFLLNKSSPTNPLIAGQRSNVFPQS